jgi:exosortase A-associated hydrolase 2
MRPLFFGDSRAPLFGVYHPPRARPGRQTGVVLCYPFGQEYMRAHRAFRQLAMLLTRAGHHVLRFDYFGTGDSAGEADAADLDRWTEDVTMAREELRDMTGCHDVSLVGLRLGAVMASRSASQAAGVRTVVLWDPVVDGAGYVRSLLKLADATATVDSDRADSATPTIGVNGFPLTGRLRSELARIRLADEPPPRSTLALIVSERRADYDGLRNRLEERAEQAAFRHIPGPSNWDEVDRFGSVLLPQDIIHGVVEALAAEAT